MNPKRLQREAKHQLEQTGIGTRSQQALKLQHEQMKVERKVISREMKEAEKPPQALLRQCVGRL